jgi:eukaryotic-like serine/threonine-protein kinase
LTEPQPVPLQLLDDYLRADAHVREALLARIFAVVTTAVALVAISADLIAGDVRQGLIAFPIMIAAAAYHAVITVAIRRGFWRAWLPWVNTFLQASLPIVLLCAVAASKGADQALAQGVSMFMAIMVAVTAMRANVLLSVLAGVLVAAEFGVVYWLYLMPMLPPDAVAFKQSGMVTWPAALIAAGFTAAVLGRYLVRTAERALRAVREQDLFGKYVLGEPLGSGGMADVFRATYSPEGGFEKPVALKRVRADLSRNPEFIQMLREEGRLGALLLHPGVVQVLDVGIHRGQYVIAMEYVDGMSLHRLIESRGKGLSAAAVCFLGSELAAALDYIHQRRDGEGAELRLVHRDVNPANVLVSRRGEVKLADFGVARAAIRSTMKSDRLYGKLHYMAPEQVRGEPFDGRADLFALGLTLHEALTGQSAIDGARTTEVINKVASFDGRELGGLWADAPAPLAELLSELVDPAPAARPKSGAAVRARLLAMPEGCAPYPHGQDQLAAAIAEASPVPAAARPPSTAVTRR